MALSLLYVSQGIPFGFASEYLPVVLRQQGYSLTAVAAVGWLQLPWQLKIFWASAADRPFGRRHATALLLTLQALLALAIAAFGVRAFAGAPKLWFALTFVAALIAATQDIFVDALAVRTLDPGSRGLGNTAQVAGYRLGLLVGGAGLLLLATGVGERVAILACAAVVVVSSYAGVYLRRGESTRLDGPSVTSVVRAARLAANDATSNAGRRSLGALARHLVSRRSWRVAALALTFKLGLHMAGVLLKPMAVDAHWTSRQIGWAIVTVGTGCGLAGSAAGGVLHRLMPEGRVLTVAATAQALVCLPLALALARGVPLGWTTVAIAAEHFASALGTTVLFAALMSATREADAGLHYTALMTGNVVCISLGGVLGGVLGDHIGKGPVFVLAALVSLVPLALLPRWAEAAEASAA